MFLETEHFIKFSLIADLLCHELFLRKEKKHVFGFGFWLHLNSECFKKDIIYSSYLGADSIYSEEEEKNTNKITFHFLKTF